MLEHGICYTFQKAQKPIVNNRNMNKKGFTLVELLIVIAIVGILASVTLVGIGPIQKKGRDARRISDLKEIQAGLELYFSRYGCYPGDTPGTCPAARGQVAWSQVQASLQNSNLSLHNIPNDPVNGKSYIYAVEAGGAGYVIGANLDDPSTIVLQNSVTSTDVYGLNCSQTSSTYCIQL
jgi:prepilin-type N-terminal cleavage/methylation domain-containing protein